MALKPFQRRVGSPRAVPLTQVRQTPIPDIGPQLRRLGGEIAQYGLEIRGEEAERKAIQDVALAQIPKNEDGNFIMPEPERGGRIYRSAFERSMVDRYSIEVTSDLEKKLNDLYYNQAEKFGRTPDELRAEAAELIEVTITNSNPLARANISRVAFREQNQRDLAYRQGFQRKQNELTDATLSNATQRAISNIVSISETVDTSTEAGRLAMDGAIEAGREFVQQRINADFLPQDALDTFNRTVESIEGIGKIKQQIFADSSLDADDLLLMRQVINGADGEIFGLSFRDLTEQFLPEHLNELKSTLGERATYLARDERNQAQQAGVTSAYSYLMANGRFPFGTKQSDAEAAAVELLANNGFNVNNLNGEATTLLLSTFQNVGDIPKKIFGNILQNVESSSDEAIFRAMDVFQALQNPPVEGGEIAVPFEDYASNKTLAFLDIAIRAKNEGNADPIAFARATQRGALDLGVNRSDNLTGAMTNIQKLINQTEARTKGLIRGALADAGIDYDDLSPLLETNLAVSIQDKTLSGMSFENAALVTASQFLSTHTIVEEGSPFLQTQSEDAYIPTKDLPPLVSLIGVNGEPSENTTYQWVKPYINLRLDNLDLPETLPRENLTAGENVFLKLLPGSNNVFSLIYSPGAGEAENIIRDTNGNPALIDLGLAAQIQNNELATYNAGRIRDLDNLASLRNNIVGDEGRRIINGEIVPTLAGIPGLFPASVLLKTFGDLTSPTEGYAQAEEEFKSKFGNTRVERLISEGKINEIETGMFLVVPPTLEHIALQPTRLRNAGLWGGPEHNERVSLVRSMASELGVKDYELAAILLLESNMDPTKLEAIEGRHVGLYQMSPTVQSALGVNGESSFADQLASLPRYLAGDHPTLGNTGYQSGMGWRKLYRSINGGNINANGSDRESGPYATMEAKLGLIQEEYFDRAKQWLGYRQN